VRPRSLSHAHFPAARFLALPASSFFTAATAFAALNYLQGPSDPSERPRAASPMNTLDGLSPMEWECLVVAEVKLHTGRRGR
jgi:hypothetical protein